MLTNITKDFKRLQDRIAEYNHYIQENGLVDFQYYSEVSDYKFEFLYYNLTDFLTKAFMNKGGLNEYEMESILDAFDKVYFYKTLPMEPNFDLLKGSWNDIPKVSIKAYGDNRSIVQDLQTNNPILLQILLWIRMHIMESDIEDFKYISLASIINQFYNL